jgi:O-antigen/teichoic acid export membrane protein
MSYMFLSVVVRFNVPSGVQRFYYRREGDHRRELVTSSYVYMALLSVGTALVLIALAGRLADLVEGTREPIRVSILLLALALPVELTWNYLVLLLRLQRRAVAFSVANLVRVLVTPVLTVVLVVVLEQGIRGVFQAKLASLVLITAGTAFVTRSEFIRQIRFSTFRQVVAFALPGHPGLILKSVMNVLPRYVLAYFAPMAAVGLFGIAMRISSVMKIYVDAFNRAWNPFAYANEGAEDEREIYQATFKAFCASLLFVVALLSLFAPELLALLAPASYSSASVLVPGVAFHLAVDGLTLLFSTILYTRSRVGWTSYLAAVKLVVFLLTGLFLAPRYGAAGVVGALVVASLVYGGAYAAVALRVFHFRVAGLRILGLFGLTVVVIFGLNAIEAPALTLIGSKIAGLAALVAMTFYGLFTRKERGRVLVMLRSMR